jgi:hypothetical protein
MRSQPPRNGRWAGGSRPSGRRSTRLSRRALQAHGPRRASCHRVRRWCPSDVARLVIERILAEVAPEPAEFVDPPGCAHISLALVDAVYSIRLRYSEVRRVVAAYCQASGTPDQPLAARNQAGFRERASTICLTWLGRPLADSSRSGCLAAAAWGRWRPTSFWAACGRRCCPGHPGLTERALDHAIWRFESGHRHRPAEPPFDQAGAVLQQRPEQPFEGRERRQRRRTCCRSRPHSPLLAWNASWILQRHPATFTADPGSPGPLPASTRSATVNITKSGWRGNLA